MSISFKNTKHHAISPSGTTKKIAKELTKSPLAIFVLQNFPVIYIIILR